MVNNTNCSSSGSGFYSQYTCSSQPPETPILEDLSPLLALVATRCACDAQMYKQATHTHTQITFKNCLNFKERFNNDNNNKKHKTKHMIVLAFNTSTLEAVAGSLPADPYSRF